MSNENQGQGPLHALIPLEDFKAILGVDDREDQLSRFCLVTATFTIEQYCKRRLLGKKHTEYHTYTGDPIFPLGEYPVQRVLDVHRAGQPPYSPESKLQPEYYYCLPDAGIDEDIPVSLVLRPPQRLNREEYPVRVHYLAGYAPGKVPPDLASACLELAAWNLARYRTRRVGMTGPVRGEGLELSIPEQVRQLLEPYRRKVL